MPKPECRKLSEPEFSEFWEFSECAKLLFYRKQFNP
jgi:hypothetical protein